MLNRRELRIFLKLLSIFFYRYYWVVFFLITFFTIIFIYLHLMLNFELHRRNYIYYIKLRIMHFFLTLATHVRVSPLSKCIISSNLFSSKSFYNLTETLYVYDYNFYHVTHFAYNTHDRGTRHDNLLIKAIKPWNQSHALEK